MAGHARSHSLTSRPLAALASTKGGEGGDRGAAPCPAGSRARERRRAVAALAPRRGLGDRPVDLDGRLRPAAPPRLACPAGGPPGPGAAPPPRGPGRGAP